MSHVRWTVVALLFFAVTINYVDRAVIGVLKPLLDEALGWDQRDYGWMVTAFQAAYAIGYAVSGRLLDHFGIRLGFAVAVALWSVAAMAHGAMATVLGFIAARAALGLAQGGTLPAAVKACQRVVSERAARLRDRCVQRRQQRRRDHLPGRVMARGPLGLAGRIRRDGSHRLRLVGRLAVDLPGPDQHPGVNAEELAYIRKDPPDPPRPPVPWAALLGKPQTWAFMLGMMGSSPVWWFYIFWVPDFLNKQFGLGLTQSSLPLVVIFTVASRRRHRRRLAVVGTDARGWTVNAARKTALLVCSACILPVFITPLVPVTHVWWAVAIVTLAAAAHCGYAANLFTLVSDTVPRQAVSSVVGIGGMAGSIAACSSPNWSHACCMRRTTTSSSRSRSRRARTRSPCSRSTCCCRGSNP